MNIKDNWPSLTFRRFCELCEVHGKNPMKEQYELEIEESELAHWRGEGALSYGSNKKAIKHFFDVDNKDPYDIGGR